MTSTDDRNHSDCQRAKVETRDIHTHCEPVDRNLMKSPRRGRLARRWTWTPWGNEGEPRCAADAVFVQIYYKTFLLPRKSQENLGFLVQTPRSQCDLINIQLSTRVVSLLKSQGFFCCEFIEQLFRIFLGFLTTF
jgi:hypothetical protein